MTGDATPPPVFVRGNDHLDHLLSDPQVAADVAEANAAAEEMDRVYAMNLAMIRSHPRGSMSCSLDRRWLKQQVKWHDARNMA
jgi:hypothetical protein